MRLRGEWALADSDLIRRAVEFIDSQAANPDPWTAAEVIAIAATGAADAPLPVMSVSGTGLLGDLLAGTTETALTPIAPPSGLAATLRPYQERGLAWLAFLSELGLGACLADDMGLGKTIQLLALEAHERELNPSTGPTLLLCPMSLVGNWQRESPKFTDALRVYAHHGTGRLSGAELADHLKDVDIVVTTYQTAARDLDDLKEHTWARLVLDEAQAIKNHLAQSSKAVAQLRAGHRVTLTGTPVENKLTEMWSIMNFLNPGILGSPGEFRTRYAEPIERYGQTEVAARLRGVTRPYILRRLKTDATIAPDLPEKIEIKEYCNLTREQASLYQSVVNEMLTKIEESAGIERRGNVLATMTKLKQVCNHPAQLLHDRSPIGTRSGKVARLHDLVGEILDAGEKVLLFT